MLPDLPTPLALLLGLLASGAVYVIGTAAGRLHRSIQQRSRAAEIEAIRQGMLRHAAADDHHHRARMGLNQGD
ncbi:hypothetical protein CFBP5507_04265 [Agrobacterium salinitolerans]|uniref:Uncharacterized protein n=1 Tax=Agrobacterium salinitolerans TaxID=1183413 RepID=A0A4Z1QX26_9HYPH|nr:hypothetical protein [Agrobacterium salinitolerans]UYZ08228.1 hypothetical protein CFBP5507_04265 [Agrobacterium salinitolerans]